MKKIVTIDNAVKISKKLREQGKSIVLVGGCFDILHIGHIKFLKNARKYADFILVLLESDETIKKIKGENRPINSQKNRADILSSLCYVDYVIMLPQLKENIEYDKLVFKIKPDIIATTKGDPNRKHKERQAKVLNAEIIEVINNISNKSTSNLIALLEKDHI